MVAASFWGLGRAAPNPILPVLKYSPPEVE